MGSKRMRKGATSLRGRRVVLTGALTSMTRAEAHAAIRAAGGITQDQVRKAGHRADLLVMGERPGSKLDVALACEIEIWGEGELLSAIGRRGSAIEAKPTADDTAPCEAAIELAQLVKRGAA